MRWFGPEEFWAKRKSAMARTLDPAAAGVLPLLVGRATKLFDEVTGKEKTYIAEFVFGTGTDTLDGDGTVTSVRQPSFSRSDLQQALGSFIGNISQRPPMYSAIQSGRTQAGGPGSKRQASGSSGAKHTDKRI